MNRVEKLMWKILSLDIFEVPLLLLQEGEKEGEVIPRNSFRSRRSYWHWGC